MATYKVAIFDHIRQAAPTREELFDTAQEARSRCNELGEQFIPASVVAPDGRRVCSNYPNPYMGWPDTLREQERLWDAKDPSWKYL